MALRFRLLILVIIMAWALGAYRRNLHAPIVTVSVPAQCKPETVYVTSPVMYMAGPPFKDNTGYAAVTTTAATLATTSAATLATTGTTTTALVSTQQR